MNIWSIKYYFLGANTKMDTSEFLEKINNVLDKIESEKKRVNELLLAKENIEIDRLRNDSSDTSEYTYPSIST